MSLPLSIKNKLRLLSFNKKRPVNATVVITERCHLDCQQCYLVENPRPEMSLQQLKQVIDQLAEAGTLWLTLTGGEPLLRPDIYDLLEHARLQGMASTIFTSGTPCNMDRVTRLANAGLNKASISLYAADPKLHDQITQHKGSHEKTIQGAKNLLEKGIEVEFKFLQMTINRGQLLPTKKLAEQIGAKFRYHFNITASHDGKRESMELQMNEDFLVDIHHQIVEHFPKGFSRVIPLYVAPKDDACTAGHSRIVVGTDGDAYACIDMNLPVGNIFQNSIEEIWNGQEMKKIRGIQRFSDPICLVCPDRNFCPRCPGSSMLDSGDPGKPSHNTCMVARVRKRVYEERTGQRASQHSVSQQEQEKLLEYGKKAATAGCSSCGDLSFPTKPQEIETPNKSLTTPPVPTQNTTAKNILSKSN